MSKRKFDKFVKDLFTGRDNKTYDIGRVLWFGSAVAFVGLTAYAIHQGGIFDPIAWGTGMAAIIGAGGVALGFKASTEPKNYGERQIDEDMRPMGDGMRPLRDEINPNE